MDTILMFFRWIKSLFIPTVAIDNMPKMVEHQFTMNLRRNRWQRNNNPVRIRHRLMKLRRGYL